MEVNAHSLFSKWFSESGKLVSKLFSKIGELVEEENSLVFVLIDEVESLTSARKVRGHRGGWRATEMRLPAAVEPLHSGIWF